jgi:2-keto-3-deoxy-L-arabinonate dehydratase
MDGSRSGTTAPEGQRWAARTVTRFAGIRPVLHVPFRPDDGRSVAWSELETLAQRMLEAGVDGLVVLGLASEAWTLTEVERDEAVDRVAAVVAGRVPIVVGIDGATNIAIDRAARAARRGAAGLMVLPPRRSTNGAQVTRHFALLAEHVGLPVLVQDSPQVTGVQLELPTIEALVAVHPLVSALKVEIPGAGVKTSAAHAAGMEIVAGWGGLGYLEQLARGASGCMPGCDLGPALLAVDRLARAGEQRSATTLYRSILPLLAFETPSLDLLLLSAKRHLRRRGIFSSEVLREPARVLDDVESATLDALLDELAGAEVPGFTD